MKIYPIGIILISLLISIPNTGWCQDVHFSQFYQTPLIVNPALTGVFSGDQRGIINYRNQWNDFAPFTTSSISFDSKIDPITDCSASILFGSSSNLFFKIFKG